MRIFFESDRPGHFCDVDVCATMATVYNADDVIGVDVRFSLSERLTQVYLAGVFSFFDKLWFINSQCYKMHGHPVY